jgi:hypothetical protein
MREPPEMPTFPHSARSLARTAAKPLLIALTAGFVTACNKSPTGPAPAPAPRVEATIVGTKGMGGPELLQVGETARYSVIAIMSDRSERDVTNEAQWSGSDAVSISGPGLVTGRAPGVTELTAVVGGHRVQGRVTVLLAGTYRLEGQVHEADDHYPWQGMAGVRIDVTTGTGAGLSTLTNAWGAYRFDGVAGETTLRVTRDGYQSIDLKFSVVSHRNYDIELPLLAPRANVSGTYNLTITAADNCGVGVGEGYVPEEARIRTYTANVRQDGPTLDVSLSGGTFLPGTYEGRFPGRVEPGRVVFDFWWYDGDLPSVAEQLAGSRVLVVYGSVIARGSANHLAGTLTTPFPDIPLGGVFSIFEGGFLGRPIAWCASTNHQFVLTR